MRHAAMRARAGDTAAPPLLLLGLLLTLSVGATSAGRRLSPGFPCPVQCICGPSTEGDLNILCAQNDTTVLHADVSFGNYLKVDCSIGGATDYDLLDGLSVGRTALVQFHFCPLTDSLLGLADRLNITGVRTLSIGQADLAGIDSQHFTKFPNITRLLLQRSELTALPPTLLEGLPNLRYLDLLENKIRTVPTGFFDATPDIVFLELGANNITRLEPGTFSGLKRLKYLNLWGNSLGTVSGPVFSGLSGLESLDVHHSGIETLLPGVFDELPNLKHVSLLKNNLTGLPVGLFNLTPRLETFKLFDNYRRLGLPAGLLANLANLTNVYLNGNNVSAVPGDLLRGSESVVNVHLQRNALTELPVELFRDTVNLQMLDISGNQLTSLPDELFASLTKLQVLKMANNQITTIQQFLFKQLNSLEELSLERNGLLYIHPKAFPVGKNCHIKNLYLAHNHMTFQDESVTFVSQSILNSCLSFEQLFLANNSISEIFGDWRQVMLRLKKLDLSNNNITVIRSDDLQFLSNKLVLNLSNNKIEQVDLQYIEVQVASFQSAGAQKGERDVQVVLRGNPIRCDCRAFSLLRYMEGDLGRDVYDFVHLVTEGLSCARPPEVAGLAVSRLEAATVTCDLPGVGCPRPCSCRGRTGDAAFIVDCSGLGLLRPPGPLPWNPLWRNYELHLDHNRLVALPDASHPGYDRVTKVFASHNNISRLDEHNLPPGLTVLELNNNNLTHIPNAAINILQNNTELERLRIDDNPWLCDCETRDLLSYLQIHFRKVEFLSNVSCSDGRPLSELSASELCPVSNTWIIAASVSVASVGVVLGALAALYYRYQHEVRVWLYAKQLCLWFVTEEELDRDKHYDAFVSYSHNDEEFVVNHLVPGLEAGPAPYKLCLHYRDWIPGEWITKQIAKSVEDSRRTVVVLSPNFLESVWGRMEFRAAHKQALSDGRARVILVLYGELGPVESLDPELRTYLSTNTYVKWGDPWFWSKLRYALPHSAPTGPVCRPPRSHVNVAFDDKLELMQPTTPTPTTPPADAMTGVGLANTCLAPLSILNKLDAKLILHPDDKVNESLKCV